MGIVKVVNSSKPSHGALRNVLQYILNPKKTDSEHTYVNGMWDKDTVDFFSVYKQFIEDKKFWDKDSGRMYFHTILSFHKDEKITGDEALDFAREWVAAVYPDHQSVISVHSDRDHCHCSGLQSVWRTWCHHEGRICAG